MTKRLYRPVDPKTSIPQMEAEVARRWAEADVFHESLRRREGAEEWVFYEGPPTANARPGIHHVEARAFKDIFCRFHTMRGRYVHRKAGWDCHGLPVEVEVEKELASPTSDRSRKRSESRNSSAVARSPSSAT